MKRRLLLGLAATLPAARGVRAQPTPEILARFPSGTFLENLVVVPDGRVLFTNYFARRVEMWAEAAGAGLWAEVPAHPVSLTALGDGRQALAVHGASFMGGPAAMRGTGAVLLMSNHGAVQGRIALPDAIFPNGGLLLAPGRLLLADSALGRIWAIDLATGGATPWLEHPLLAPVAGAPYPGVNGLKMRGEDLLISNSAMRQMLRVGVRGGMPAGAPETIAQMTGGVDDFAVAADGTIFAATHAAGLARVAPGARAPEVIAAPGVEGSTAVALAADGRALFALGTGGVTTGGTGDAVLARLRVG